MFFPFCFFQKNRSINERFIPNYDCILLLDSIFSNLLNYYPGGSIFCDKYNQKLKIFNCIFLNIQCGNFYEGGGAIYFNSLNNSSFYLKCCFGENCQTLGSNSHEFGQFICSFVSNDGFNIFEENSIAKSSSYHGGLRSLPFFLKYGVETFHRNNISHIHFTIIQL